MSAPIENWAFLAIDVQAGLLSGEEAPTDAESVVSRIRDCMAFAREHGRPVFLVQHDGDEADNVAPGSEGWELHPNLMPSEADLRIRKTACDSFYRTPLERELRTRGIRAIVVAGYATEFCVDATVRNAVSKDFEVVVLKDAHTTNDSQVLPAQVIRDHHNATWPNCAGPHAVRVMSAREFMRQAQRPADAPAL